MEGGIVLAILCFASVIALTVSLIVYLAFSIQTAALTFVVEGLSFGGLIKVESSEQLRNRSPLRFWPILLTVAGGFLSTYGNLNCWIACADSNWRMAALLPAIGILLVGVGVILSANRLRTPFTRSEAAAEISRR